MPWLVAQLSSLMRRNIRIVKDSSLAASNAEQKIFMTMSLIVRLVGFFVCFISVRWWGGKMRVGRTAFQIGFIWCRRRYHIVSVLLFIALEQMIADRIVLKYFSHFYISAASSRRTVRLTGFINLFAHSCDWLLL